jgi:hypothetical protein
MDEMKSLLRKLFYFLKPLIPRRFQLSLRRSLVLKQKEKYSEVWPILKSAYKPPVNWKSWPNDKDFAFVLTHDVELRNGHDKCIQLMEVEKKLGFKSSFNFVPERYKVDRELRDTLVNSGFEVGVHGLNHDGKLFQNKKIFDERAKKINSYLKDWNAVGFRAPAMHHNLDWIAELNLEYDLSTFDTDPFEPQSDGVGNIFPFWFENSKEPGRGYIELPYTLVQDFTLLVLMGEENADIWKLKLDWIAEKEGMALLNVHPDYIDFSNSNNVFEKFPVSIYEDFLFYIKSKYDGKYWNALPREIAAYSKKMLVN